MPKLNSSDRIVTGMFWRFGEKITAQLVSFIVSIILARMLVPDDFGIIALVNIFIVIAEVFVTSGLGTSLIQKKDVDEKDFSTVFWCNIVVSLLIYTIVFFASPAISRFFNMPLLTNVLRVFGLRLPIAAVNSIQGAYIARRMDFKKFFFATLIGTIISGVVGIVMAYNELGVWALVAQYLTNAVIDTLVLFIIIKWKPILCFDFSKATPLINYGWKILVTDLVGQIFNQLNAFIIGKKYSSEDLAFYTQGKRIPDLVNNNINGALSTVLFSAMSMANNKEEIVKIRRKSLKMIEYLLFPLMSGMMVVADRLVSVLLTEKWLFSVPFVRITCLASIIGVMGITFIQEIKAIGRSDITLKMELIKKPIFLMIAISAMQWGVTAIAWSLVLNEVIAFFFNVYPVKKHIGYVFKTHLKDALPTLLMSATMVVGTYIVGRFISSNLVGLIVQVVVGGAIYIGLSYVTRNECFIYLVTMPVRKFKG